VARAEETLTVEPVDETTARLLTLTPGSPAVVIARLAFGYDGQPMEWRCSRGSAATFRYQIEIR